MSGLCVVSSVVMSVLDGLWRPVFLCVCVIRVMSFAMGEDVSQIVVCNCVVRVRAQWVRVLQGMGLVILAREE